jgi:hypothetical protein
VEHTETVGNEETEKDKAWEEKEARERRTRDEVKQAGQEQSMQKSKKAAVQSEDPHQNLENHENKQTEAIPKLAHP